MPFARFAVAFPVIAMLAACGGNPQPPATPNASAPKATVASPAAPAKPATPAKPAAPVVAAKASALEPLIGTWAADLGNCGGEGEITLSAKEFVGAENRCAIASFGDNGDGTFTATMTCDSQGQKTTERIAMDPVFAPTGEGINFTYLDRNNEEVTVLRCAAARTAAQ